MKLLALSTAEKECSLAYVENRTVVCEDCWSSKQTHSRRLMEMIDHMFSQRSCGDIEDIDGFVVAKGPGSFTGLRIGISVVKGLAFALSKPVAGISSLDGIAWRFSSSGLPVCVMMDAKRKEVYAAVYRFRHGKIIEKSAEVAASPWGLLDKLTGKTLFAGSGALSYQSLISDNLNSNAQFVPFFQNSIKASALAESVFETPALLDHTRDIVPVYLRKSDAEINFGQD